jgi:hypothetical protein
MPKRTMSSEGHELHLAAFTGLESQCGAGRNVETMPVGPCAIEAQVPVDLEKMCVRPDLDRAIAVIVDAKPHTGEAGVDLDRFVSKVSPGIIISGSDRGR